MIAQKIAKEHYTDAFVYHTLVVKELLFTELHDACLTLIVYTLIFFLLHFSFSYIV